MISEDFVKALIGVSPPWIHLVVCQGQIIVEQFMHQFRSQENFQQIVIRTMLGNRCLTKRSLLREFARALEFPSYFGYNWDALDECIRDLADWLPGKGYILLVLNAGRMLANSEDDFKTLAAILESAAGEWASCQSPIPFHTVLQCPPREKEHMLARMQATGAGFSFWNLSEERV